jgi:DNA-directed RNA polymerase specialized sigma24 family protein
VRAARARFRRSRASFADGGAPVVAPLTDYQRRIAESHVGLVGLVAAEVRTRKLSYAERFSAAQEGLCDAASRWQPTTPGEFRPFARTRMRWYILRDIRAKGRCFRSAAPIEADPPCPRPDRPGAAVDTRDAAEWVLDRLYLATGRQREAVLLVHAGLAQAEICRRMGMCKGGVDRLVRSAARRIRAISLDVLNRRPTPPARPG